MKKLLAGITLFVILVLCLGSPATAAMVNQWHGGDGMVYDTANGTHWYLYLTNAAGMTRSEYTGFIATMNVHSHVNPKDWDWAACDQGSDLIRTVSSPRLVPNIYSEKSFAITGDDDTVTWKLPDADDHWMAIDLLAPGRNAKMTFNSDKQYRPDEATNVPFIGGSGAWIVSDVRLIPAPGTLLLASMGVGLVGYLRRRRTL